jgi:mRNA-degrading endonuclease RelE of RelBE toxin-antitoxin system
MGLSVQQSDAFRRQYGRLPEQHRRRVKAAIEKLRLSPDLPGLNVERVKGATGKINSCRVSAGMRLLFEHAQEGICLLAVGGHDFVYREGLLYLIPVPALGSEEIPVRDDLGGWTVFESYDLMEDLWPEELDDLRAEFLDSIQDAIRDGLKGGTQGKASVPPSMTSGAAAQLNVIPGASTAPCRPVLVAFCFDGDQFGDRLREIAYHSGIHCPQTRFIVLVTSQWNPREWKRNHETAFDQLAARYVIYFFGFESLTLLRS